jgi:phosphohistidine phosphatase
MARAHEGMLKIRNIIVWRHAEAELAGIESYESNMARALTSRGQQQAERMARWLKRYLPKQTMLLSSPALRALQTAQAFNYKVIIEHALSPGASLQEILEVLISLESSQSNLLLVGHQPWLGQLVTHLTGFSGAELNIKKGAIWWMRLSLKDSNLAQHPRYNVITVQAPSLVPK